MPIALIIVGLLMVVSGVKNTYSQFGTQIKSDFTGPGNFTTWLAAIGLIGAVGYVPPLRAFANSFLVLVLLVIVLKNGGAFAKLQSALASGPAATPANPAPVIPSSSSTGSNTAAPSTAGKTASNVLDIVGVAAAFA